MRMEREWSDPRQFAGERPRPALTAAFDIAERIAWADRAGKRERPSLEAHDDRDSECAALKEAVERETEMRFKTRKRSVQELVHGIRMTSDDEPVEPLPDHERAA